MPTRTTLIIDDGLLDRARELTGIEEKTALVRAGIVGVWQLERPQSYSFRSLLFAICQVSV